VFADWAQIIFEVKTTYYHCMNELWTEYLLAQGATFVDGRVVHFGQPVAELAATHDSLVLCDLSHEGLILATGDDASTFLQGQLSNDVLAMIGAEPAHAQWSSWCSPKGRMLVSFLMWPGKHGIYLQLPRGLQTAIQKRLQMFVLRSKVTLTDESAQWVKLGLAGTSITLSNSPIGAAFVALFGDAALSKLSTNMATFHHELGRVIRISATRFEIIANVEHAKHIADTLAAHAKWVGASGWDGFAIRDGLLQVLPQTQDAFVPQMANFELIGGVSFKKGCYPGQEIVARTQYRGILKRRTARVSGTGLPPAPGETVYAPEFADQAAGMVAMSAPTVNGGFEALVVAQVESIKADSLRLASTDGAKLQVLPLPYVLT
jgi:tRNA-modifying protein YgfZ